MLGFLKNLFGKKVELVHLERKLYIKGAIVVNRRYQTAKCRKAKQRKK